MTVCNRIVKFIIVFIAIINLAHGEDSKKPSIVFVVGPFELSEGPHWDEKLNVLYFVDIYAQKVHCWNPQSKKLTHVYIKNGPVGVAVPVLDCENTFTAASGKDLVEVLWDHDTNNSNPDIKLLRTVDANRIKNRFNDGKVDPRGRFWAGTMVQSGEDYSTPEDATLYRFDDDGTTTAVIDRVSISNGLVWNHNNDTFYYIDSPMRKIFVYDYDNNCGNISNKRVLFDYDDYNFGGIPDGMTIDSNGNLWVAENDLTNKAGKVLEIDANSGLLLRAIDMPVTRVSSVAFGGPKKDILYVTSIRRGLSDAELKKQPLAGSVFAIHDLGVVGSPMLPHGEEKLNEKITIIIQ